MAWTATIVSKVKDSYGKINLVVNFDNAATGEHHPAQQINGLSNTGDVNKYIKDQLDFYQASDDTLAAINTGAYTPTVPTPPTPAEIAAATLKQEYINALNLLKTVTDLVTLGVYANATAAGLPALKTDVANRLVANPEFNGLK